MHSLRNIWERKQGPIAALAIVAIVVHLLLRFGWDLSPPVIDYPLYVALALGGLPLVFDLLGNLLRREFGSDLLAGISIVTAILLGEYLAGTLVVLMLSGGETIEAYAVQRASSALSALANRMPSTAHRRTDGAMEEVALADIEVGDELMVLPHEICPVDGTVLEGHSVMDESYLTGEPYKMSKAAGSSVLSGSINGESALAIRADKRAVDSRYAKIMEVMRESEQRRPRIRRLGDQLGAIYTPIALVIAIAAWYFSGSAVRFLAVLVVATPCPLLIGIPVAVIGSISLAARMGIIVRNPAVLEQIAKCRTAIFDKTGTLTYGRPKLTRQTVADGFNANDVLALVASLERYSKHPLAAAVVDAARQQNAMWYEVDSLSEPAGRGLRGRVKGREIEVTGRGKVAPALRPALQALGATQGGLECVVLIDGRVAAVYGFRDEPRREGAAFIHHLGPKHALDRVLLVSGDREAEVSYLAERVGITDVRAEQSPEQKVAIVREEEERAPTIFIGDGINDAPALVAATVGVALGQHSDVTTEAADTVILDSSLQRVDEFFHISNRMRSIALQSAVGGMLLSIVGMGFAAAGYLPPVAGAIMQEIIDVAAVMNALRAAFRPKSLTDF
ncbi:MAG: heavy metal translocating P-type ATPase [Phycisphaerae bacterium]